MSDDDFGKRVLAVCLAAGEQGSPSSERADILLTAYLITAANARNEAIIEPGGYLAEQARQLERLERAAALIKTDVPDVEAERLFHEGDIEGMLRHLLKRGPKSH